MRQAGLLDEIRLPLVLRVDVVTKTKEPEVAPIAVTLNLYNEKWVVAKVREIWKCVSSGVCYLNLGWACAGGGYKTLCGKWPDISG